MCAVLLHIRDGLVPSGHATVPVTLAGVPHYPHTKDEGLPTSEFGVPVGVSRPPSPPYSKFTNSEHI